MATFKITTSATFNLKLHSPGYIRSISCPSAGTAWTLQINDGPNPAGTVVPLYGATPVNITTNIGLLAPLYFSQGCQIVMAGASPGEVEFDVV